MSMPVSDSERRRSGEANPKARTNKKTGKNAGSIADMSATSFYPTKPLAAYGDGGAVFSNTNEENELVKSCRVHGMSPEDHYEFVWV